MDVLMFIVANWWWISIVLMGILGLLKFASKKTTWVWDDRVVTLLIGLVRMSRGKTPVQGHGGTG